MIFGLRIAMTGCLEHHGMRKKHLPGQIIHPDAGWRLRWGQDSRKFRGNLSLSCWCLVSIKMLRRTCEAVSVLRNANDIPCAPELTCRTCSRPPQAKSTDEPSGFAHIEVLHQRNFNSPRICHAQKHCLGPWWKQGHFAFRCSYNVCMAWSKMSILSLCLEARQHLTSVIFDVWPVGICGNGRWEATNPLKSIRVILGPKLSEAQWTWGTEPWAQLNLLVFLLQIERLHRNPHSRRQCSHSSRHSSEIATVVHRRVPTL